MTINVVLICPKLDATNKRPPVVRDFLGIAYMAATLRRRNIQVQVINAENQNLSPQEVAGIVSRCRPLLVGLSVLQCNYKTAYAIGELIRGLHPSAHITAGGHHATFAWRNLLQECPSLDSILIGEADYTICELADRLARQAPLEDIPGLVTRGEDGCRVGPPPSYPLNLDELPFPSRDQYESDPAPEQSRLLTMMTSRGCLGNCTYCDTPSFMKLGAAQRWRGRTAGSVIAELEALVAKYSPSWTDSYLHIVDDDFLGGEDARARAGELAKEIHNRKIPVKFKISARADSVLASYSILPDLKIAGFEQIFVGMEAGEESTLQLYGKNTSPEMNTLAIRLLRGMGMLDPTCGYILFNPYTSLEQVRINSTFLIESGFVDPLILFWQLEVHPGTPMERKLRNDGLLNPEYSAHTPLNYQFADLRVKTLAHALMGMRKQLRKASNMLYHFDRITLALSSTCKDRFPQVQSRRALIDIHKEQIGSTTLKFMASSLKLAEGSWSQERFMAIKTEYLNALYTNIKVLEAEIASFIGTCQEVYEGENF